MYNDNSEKSWLQRNFGKLAVAGLIAYYLLKDEEEILRTHFLFISHSWDYNDDYYRIKSLLDVNENFKWNDYSIPIEKRFAEMPDADLSKKIESKIKHSHCVIFIAGMYFTHRKWMDIELKLAKKHKIPIICLRPRGAKQIPTKLTESADRIVGWNSYSLIKVTMELTEFKT